MSKTTDPDYMKKYYQRNKARMLSQMMANYWQNRASRLPKAREYSRKYRQQNKEKIRNYELQHKHRRFEIRIKSLKKSASILGVPTKAYKFALQTWSEIIRKNQPFCVICGKPSVVAHHLIHKQFYPKLSLNLHNGIGLCLVHHNEVHGRKLR